MSPVEFQYLASRLAEHGAYPSEFRTAISRSYYAVFNLGISLLGEMGFLIIKNQYAHHEVYLHFNNSGDTDLIKVASKFGDLRTRRNHADYDLARDDVEKKETAKMLVYSAGRLIETMDKCCKGPKRGEIIKSIQDWKKSISA